MTTDTQVRYVRPPLYPKQEEALFNTARYGVTEASTKSGKTVASIVWLHEQAALGGAPGRNYWWIAPIRRTARIAFKRLKLFLPRDTFEANETERTISLLNGSTLSFLGAENPDSLYGEDVYAAVIDEASRVKAESWYAVRTTLTATEGPVRIIGNVKGRRNWAYKLARKAEAGAPGFHYAKLTVWDAVQAGIFSPEEADDARDTLPDTVFRELYLAEAVDADEAFFDTSRMSIVQAVPDHVRTARAWDFAVSAHKSGSNPDYTVGAKLGHADRHTYVIDVIRRRAAPDKIAQLVQQTAAADGRACDQMFEEEFGAAGKMMVAQFKTTLSAVEGAGRVYPASVTGGKEVRAFHFASACNDRRVSVVEADWNHEFFGELDDFPDGDKDDQVDAAAHAFNHLAPNLKPRVRWL